MKISYSPNMEEQNVLKMRGVHGSIYSVPAFDLDKHTHAFTTSFDGLRPQHLTKRLQQQAYRDTLNDTLDTGYRFCISSEPNDSRSKLVAATLMLSAYRADPKARMLWHQLTGSYRDRLRDDQPDLDFLVLSGVPCDMTDVKREKLRDILELYSEIPTVIATTGCDPVAFFNRLRLSVSRVLFIRSLRQNIGSHYGAL